MIGVYCIKNTNNGKMYIGSSIDVQKRWKQHLRELRLGKHHSYKLQKDFNKHGELSFEFYVLKECCKEDLIAEEQLIIDESRCVEIGYNVAPFANKVTTKFDNLFAQYPDLVDDYCVNIKSVLESEKVFGCDLLSLHSETESSPKTQLRRFVKASNIIREVVEISNNNSHYKLNRCKYLHGGYDYSLVEKQGSGEGGVETLLSRLFYEMEQSACGRALMKRFCNNLPLH